MSVNLACKPLYNAASTYPDKFREMMHFRDIYRQAWNLTRARKHYWFFGKSFRVYQIAVLQNGAKEIDSGADLYAYDEDGALSRRWTGRELLWGLGLVGIGFFLHGLFNTLWRIYLPDIEWLYPIVAGGLALLAFMVLRTRFSFDLFSQVEVGGEQSREFTKRRASDLWQLLKQEHPAFFRRSVLLSSLAILPFLIYIGIGSFLLVNAASQLAIDLRILAFPFIFLALPIASIPYIYTQFLLLLAYIQLSQHYPPNASTLRQQN